MILPIMKDKYGRTLTEYICHHCGTKYFRKKGQNYGANHCCSRKCSSASKQFTILVPDEQYKSRYRQFRPNGQRVFLHRIVAEQKLGRPLKVGEVVHHVNGNSLDNRPENLQIMTQAEHFRIHRLIPLDETRLKILSTSGQSAAAIARELKCSVDTIRKRMKNLGLWQDYLGARI